MRKFTILLTILLIAGGAGAQIVEDSRDTFFLAKKKGVLGKLGRSISKTSVTSVVPLNSAERFSAYKGKIIRFIETVPVGFNQNLNDTTIISSKPLTRLASRIHKNSRNITIRKNLFFKEGDILLPILIADNERYLRDQPFLRDAEIVVYQSVLSPDSVDVIVLTRDVFSIGGNFSVNSSGRVRTEVREENFVGTGSQLIGSFLHENVRNPNIGFGGQFTERNIRGTFLFGTIGFKSFNNALVNGRMEENTFYVKLDKPLVNRYTEWTGSAAFSYNSSQNAYINKEVYKSDAQYNYHNLDLWAGYNIGWRRKRTTDSDKRLRHFVAARVLYTHFNKVPDIFKDSFNFNYANVNGGLVSYTLYKQNFYVSKFIYGFGINEDVPKGINASVTTGWTNKQNRMRGYFAAELDATTYSERGYFSAYTFRMGGYRDRNSFEDISLLMGLNHFTRLREINKYWYNRTFLAFNYTRNFRRKLGEPLFVQSEYGLPYLRSDSIFLLQASTRVTVKVESVFFNLKTLLGFRFAPFIFSEFAFLRSLTSPFLLNGFSAIGGGIRTRNQNLTFGTLELRAFYFPRQTTVDMSRWRIQFTTNLRFRYNSVFVKRPDFIKIN